VGLIPDRLKSISHQPDRSHVVAQCHVGDVLHEYGTWPNVLDDGEEHLPQVAPRIQRSTDALVDEIADLRSAGARKRLAGRATCDEVDIEPIDEAEKVLDTIGFGQVQIEA